MKKSVFAIVSSVFILTTCFIETSVLARDRDPELSYSQKQEILEVLGQIKRRTEEIKRYNKRQDDLYKGEDEHYNTMAKDWRKEGEDIMASPVGQRLGRKMRGWDKSDKTKPITDFLDEEEAEALKRVMYIGDELDEIRDEELEKIYFGKSGSESSLAYHQDELKKLEEKYGKAAVDALREDVEERGSEIYQIDAYPVNEKLVGAKGQTSIFLYTDQNNANILINIEHRKVTSDNVMKIIYFTTKNNYPISKFKKTDDKVFFTIDSVEYEHLLYVKHSLIGLGMGSKNTFRKDWEVQPYTKNKKISSLEGVINLSDGSFNGKCGKMTFKGKVTVQ